MAARQRSAVASVMAPGFSGSAMLPPRGTSRRTGKSGQMVLRDMPYILPSFLHVNYTLVETVLVARRGQAPYRGFDGKCPPVGAIFRAARQDKPGINVRCKSRRLKTLRPPRRRGPVILGACTSDAGQKETAGTILGGIGGAVLGSQIGSGSGQIVATAVGTLGGRLHRQRDRPLARPCRPAAAMRQAEQRAHSRARWRDGGMEQSRQRQLAVR